MAHRWRVEYVRTKGTDKGRKMADLLTVAYLVSVKATQPEALAKLKSMIAEAERPPRVAEPEEAA